MRLKDSTPDVLLSASIVKMEDKKRPAMHEHESTGPPLKRQATSVNGGSKPHPDADMPWKDDIERYQKDAILRQMGEYKREAKSLEARLNEITKRSTYHDDHLRAIDTWWDQLCDEIRVTLGELDDVGVDKIDHVSIPPALLFANTEKFMVHFRSKAEIIRSFISDLQKKLPTARSPDTLELQQRVTGLLAAEKLHVAELEQVQVERDQLQERLDTASLRYMKAEKKYDRVRSTIVQKMEQQGNTNSGKEGNGIKNESPDVNGNVKGEHPEEGTVNSDQNLAAAAEAELARKEAVAVAEKQKDHIAKLTEDNEQLSRQLTMMNSRMTRLSDEDYSKTDLFKQLRSQHEDVIKRINNLEALNVQLRDEAEKLQAERLAFRLQVEKETQSTIADMESKLIRTEADLTRIRQGRDDCHAQLTVRQQAEENERSSVNQIRELAAARQDRIEALELETERLRLTLEKRDEGDASQDGLEELGLPELKDQHQNLKRQYEMLNSELPAMGTAWKKASALASKKVGDLAAVEEKIARLQAEKSKADQKYFATMKAKDMLELQMKALQLQNQKSSEIVSQLKEVDGITKQFAINLEKQLSECKTALQISNNQNQQFQQQLNERGIAYEGAKSQLAEITGNLEIKDSTIASIKKAHRDVETEVEVLRVRSAELEKELRDWKSKGSQNRQQETDMLRNLALCPVCRSRFKNAALRLCGHLFCRECIEDRQKVRLRQCPTCSKAFGIHDTMPVHL